MTTTTTAEPVTITDEADQAPQPPIAHCYCGRCNAQREIAESVCGLGHKPRAELYFGDWPAGAQVCTVCADLEPVGCPRCGR